MRLPRRRFGSTGVDVATLGQGGAYLGLPESPGSDDQAVEAVRRAIDHGINYIDTSPAYGESERRIGLALADGYRERVLLATKTGTRPECRGDYSADATRWSLDLILKSLGTDHVDVLLVHDPPGPDSIFADRDLLKTLEALRDEGVIKLIGIGVRKHQVLLKCIRSGRFDLILTHHDCNLMWQTACEKVIPEAASRGVIVVNGSPLCSGLLIDGDPRAADRPHLRGKDRDRHRALQQWSREHGFGLTALALQYCLANQDITLTLNGASSAEEIAHSVACATTPLPVDIWQDLERDCGVPLPGAWTSEGNSA